jgi:hypothetical protein
VSVRIDWVIACHEVRERDDGFTDIIGESIDTVIAWSQPADIAFELAIRIAGFDEGRPYHFSVALFDDDNNLVADIFDEPMEFYPPIGGDTRTFPAVTRRVSVRMRVPGGGEYTISAACDGAASYRLPIHVVVPMDTGDERVRFTSLAKMLFSVPKEAIKPRRSEPSK